MNPLKKLFDLIRAPIQWGVVTHPDRAFAKRIQTTNAIALLMAYIGVPYGIYFVLIGQFFPMGIQNVVWSTLTFSVVILNRWKHFSVSRWALLIILNGMIMLAGTTLGRDSEVHLSFFIIGLIPFMIFGFNEQFKMVVGVLTSAVIFVAIDLPYFHIFDSTPNNTAAAAIEPQTERLAILICLATIVFYFRWVNDRSEKKLERTVKELKKTLDELARHQEMMVQTSKMSALGEMAAGIAHEINTPLATIKLRCVAIRTQREKGILQDSTLASSIDVVENTATRIAKIIHGLRVFAREAQGDPFQREKFSTLIAAALDLCQERFKSYKIELNVDQSPEDLEIECQSIQITQIFLNLLNNAFDAVENLADRRVSIKTIDLGDHLQVRITDTGEGVTASIRDKIFQPFFTTKAIGKGTGLGLSISKGIVEQHQGHLAFDYAEEQTTVVVTLPKRQSQQVPRPIQLMGDLSHPGLKSGDGYRKLDLNRRIVTH